MLLPDGHSLALAIRLDVRPGFEHRVGSAYVAFFRVCYTRRWSTRERHRRSKRVRCRRMQCRRLGWIKKKCYGREALRYTHQEHGGHPLGRLRRQTGPHYCQRGGRRIEKLSCVSYRRKIRDRTREGRALRGWLHSSRYKSKVQISQVGPVR